MSEKSRNTKQRTAEAFGGAGSLHPLVVGHMCKQDKSGYTFSKRYFALYDGGLLAYYTHQRDFEVDVRKHKGVPLHCTLVKLDGLYLTRPRAFYHGTKHCFTLHAPEPSNYREELLLVCRSKKDMRIWVEQLQSQNSALAPGEKPHKTPPYIQRMRLQTHTSLKRLSIHKLDSGWLIRTKYQPGDVALSFCTGSNPNTTTIDCSAQSES